MFKIERRLGYLFAAITCFIIAGACAFAAFAGDVDTVNASTGFIANAYKWSMSHGMIVTVLSSLLTLLIGWIIPNDKAIAIGFAISQAVRHIAGKKLEEKIENVIDGIDKGMHGDDNEQGK